MEEVGREGEGGEGARKRCKEMWRREEGRTNLARCHVRKHLKDLHPFLNGGHSGKYSIDHILHHDLQLFRTRPESQVLIMPARGLHI